MSVGTGFIAARTTISSPFETPPSMPPARFRLALQPALVAHDLVVASEPRSPRAEARPRSRRPSPPGSPAAPPRAARRVGLRAALTSRAPAGRRAPHLDAPAERVAILPRLVDRADRPPASGSASPGDLDPDLAQERLRHGAGRDEDRGVPREARSSASRTSARPCFCDAGEIRVPGPRQRDRLRPLPSGSPSGGQGLIPHVQFLWSRLRTTSASGVPSVRPWRRPASTSTSSVSICWRGERP
jgi:hypothetical protein